MTFCLQQAFVKIILQGPCIYEHKNLHFILVLFAMILH